MTTSPTLRRRERDSPPSVGELTEIQARGAVRGRLALLGPALVAAIAYVDPGNFAANIQAGASNGYQLVWVVLVASVIAMIVQYLAAKLGIATDRNLAEQCREVAPRWVNRVLWVQAEIIAMATDLAEFVGAALGLNLLFGVPLRVAGFITALASFVILAQQKRGRRRFEAAIGSLLILVTAGFVYDILTVGRQNGSGFVAGLSPSLGGPSTAAIAVSIVGATVMPHAIYLHSALTQQRVDVKTAAQRRHLLRFTRIDCVAGLGVAAVTNLLMLVLAAVLFAGVADIGADSITSAHARLGELVGGTAGLAFAVALLSSGLASSSVGTYAGQVVIQGFINRSMPLYVRRLVTMLPALLVLGLGLPITETLTISQDLLSFGIPFALIPLLLFTRRRDIMGDLVNTPVLTAVSALACALVIGLNVYLLSQILT